MLAVARPDPLKRNPGRFANLLKAELAQVAEQEISRCIVGHEDVELAVAVEVSDRQPQPSTVRSREARGLAHFRERAVAVVAIEQVGLGRISSRRAVNRPAGIIAACKRCRPSRISTYVTTTRSRSPSPSRSPNPAAVVQRSVASPAACRHVLERAVAPISIQDDVRADRVTSRSSSPSLSKSPTVQPMP